MSRKISVLEEGILSHSKVVEILAKSPEIGDKIPYYFKGINTDLEVENDDFCLANSVEEIAQEIQEIYDIFKEEWDDPEDRRKNYQEVTVERMGNNEIEFGDNYWLIPSEHVDKVMDLLKV